MSTAETDSKEQEKRRSGGQCGGGTDFDVAVGAFLSGIDYILINKVVRIMEEEDKL